MKKVIALLILLMPVMAMAVGYIQNEDVKSLNDLQTVVSITGNLTSGSACIVSPSSLFGISTGLFVYDTTSGTRISAGVTVVNVPGSCSAGQIQMSANALATVSGATITFGGSKAQLINSSKVYVEVGGINDQLSTAITSGVIGSGKMKPQTPALVTAGGTIAISGSSSDARQVIPLAGSSGSQTTSVTPFGAGSFADGLELVLLGTSDTNTVIIPYNDASNGAVGNFETIAIGKYDMVKCVYSSNLSRFVCSKGAL